jgi:hypothetical protein
MDGFGLKAELPCRFRILWIISIPPGVAIALANDLKLIQADAEPASTLAYLPPPHRISTRENPVYQRCDGTVKFSFAVITRIIRVRGCRVLEYPDDFRLGQDLAVVQCQQKRLADRERC